MLILTHSDYTALRAHGEETYPYECCGALLGTSTPEGNRVQQIVRAGNTRTDRAHDRYHIAPEELNKNQRQARGLGLDIVGFYHSQSSDHSRAVVADRLQRGALVVGCSYIITAIEHGKAAITNSFLLTGTGEEDKQFLDEPIEILPRPQQRQPRPAGC